MPNDDIHFGKEKTFPDRISLRNILSMSVTGWKKERKKAVKK
jgi:hypothetical protein